MNKEKKIAVEQNFVRFFSPGIVVAETTSKPIDKWDVAQAVEMAKSIKVRYGAVPYGFSFITRGRGPNDLDSREIRRSTGVYYLGGKVETLAEIKARNDPDNNILISNMEGNGWDKVLVNTNSWTWTQPLKEGDVVLDVNLRAAEEKRP